MNTSPTMSGQVAVVTGGTQGIGAAVVRKLLACGAKVVLTGRREKGLAKAREEYKSQADSVRIVQADSSLPEDVTRTFDIAIEAFGRVDMVVSNAATNVTADPLCEASLEDFRKTLDVNLTGYLLMSQEGIRRFRDLSIKGAIVHIATIGSFQPLTGLGVYCVSKAAIPMMTATLAAELAGESIRVNAVAPGIIKTRFSRGFWDNPEALAELEATIPERRIGEPEEIANVVAYLLSDQASYVNGQTLLADGGMSAHPIGPDLAKF